MLSFAISKNIFIEYTKITFYVCPYDNLVYIIYLQKVVLKSFTLLQKVVRKSLRFIIKVH